VTLIEYTVRLRTSDDHQFIVPVRAGNPEHASRFIEEFYQVRVTDHIVRYKGRALPTWCGKAQRTQEAGPRALGPGRVLDYSQPEQRQVQQPRQRKAG